MCVRDGEFLCTVNIQHWLLDGHLYSLWSVYVFFFVLYTFDFIFLTVYKSKLNKTLQEFTWAVRSGPSVRFLIRPRQTLLCPLMEQWIMRTTPTAIRSNPVPPKTDVVLFSIPPVESDRMKNGQAVRFHPISP